MSRQGHLALFFLFLVMSPLGWADHPNQQRRRSSSGLQWQQDDEGTFGTGRRQESTSQDDFSDNDNNRQAQHFRAGHTYTFVYNGQISQGLDQVSSLAPLPVAGTAGDTTPLLSSVSDTVNPPQQKAATRIQAQAEITFLSDRHAQLRLEKIRIGHMNGQIDNPEQVQPMGMFEPKQLEGKKLGELQQPCDFTYVDGVVEKINFQQQDPAWSKNMKRAVLNLIQLNLKRNNTHRVRGADELSAGQQQSDEREQESQLTTTAFALPEITIEGECQTTYTVNPAQKQGRGGSGYYRFNVTKSLDFSRCKKVVDVTYGYQTQSPHPQCAKCPAQQWAQQPQLLQQELDRSTVLRFVLQGDSQENYAIQHAELISQYTYTNLRSEASEYSSAMNAVVVAELAFKSVRPQRQQQSKRLFQSQAQPETLLYSNEWDVDKKLFYMYGDQEFPAGNNPFASVSSHEKCEKVQQLVQKLAQSASNKAKGIEVLEATQMHSIVELLRMCTEGELKQILCNSCAKCCPSNQSGHGAEQRSSTEQAKINDILAGALASAGTRNTIDALIRMIHQQETLKPEQAAQALNGLQGLPAPSDAQVDAVMHLCNNEICHRNPALRQKCWLTFGSMVSELCQQHNTSWKDGKSSGPGRRSSPNKEEKCPAHKKAIYKQALDTLYEEAETTFDKVVALKALGNAAIDTSINSLEQIIRNRHAQRICRMQAIDALRRLHTHMPRKIQRILLPVFFDTEEHPNVRMAAFSMCMATQPEQHIIDHILYALTKERSSQVKSYVYTTIKAFAKSKGPYQRELAKQLRGAMLLAGVNEWSLDGPSKSQIPIYGEEKKDSVLANIASVLGVRMPSAHWKDLLRSIGNDGHQISSLQAGDVDQLIIPVYEHISKIIDDMLHGKTPSMATLWGSLSEQHPNYHRFTSAVNMMEKSAKIPTSMGMPLSILSAVQLVASIDCSIKMGSKDLNGSSTVQFKAHLMVTAAQAEKVESWMCGNFITGVENVYGIELNIPIEAEQSQQDNDIETILKMPEGNQETRLIGVHVLPFTFVQQMNVKTNLMRKPLVKAIRNEQLEQMHQETIVNNTCMSISIQAHYHAPSPFTMPEKAGRPFYEATLPRNNPSLSNRIKEVVRLMMATENRILVSMKPSTPEKSLRHGQVAMVMDAQRDGNDSQPTERICTIKVPTRLPPPPPPGKRMREPPKKNWWCYIGCPISLALCAGTVIAVCAAPPAAGMTAGVAATFCSATVPACKDCLQFDP